MSDNFDKLQIAHLDELNKSMCRIHNFGWATGDDFIHSKTSLGKLHSQVVKRNGQQVIVHEWDNPRGNWKFTDYDSQEDYDRDMKEAEETIRNGDNW